MHNVCSFTTLVLTFMSKVSPLDQNEKLSELVSIMYHISQLHVTFTVGTGEQ